MNPKDFSEAARSIYRRPLVVAGLGIVTVVGTTWRFSSVAWWLGAPERERTAKDKKLIEFCRSVYESISPQDKLCGPYHSFLTKEIQDEKNRTMREKQEACTSCAGGKVEPPLSDCAKEAERVARSNGSPMFTHVTNGAAPNEAVLHFRNDRMGMEWTTEYICSKGGKSMEAAMAEDEELEKCLAKGLNYFVEIGSWPVLQMPPDKGRSALEVVQERCRRTTGAFGP